MPNWNKRYKDYLDRSVDLPQQNSNLPPEELTATQGDHSKEPMQYAYDCGYEQGLYDAGQTTSNPPEPVTFDDLLGPPIANLKPSGWMIQQKIEKQTEYVAAMRALHNLDARCTLYELGGEF